MKKLSIGPDETKKLQESLNKMDYFKDLGASDLGFVLNRISLYDFEPNTLIIRQGTNPPDGLYIINEGEVVVTTKKGFFFSSRTLKELGPGDFFGEIALIQATPRTASVQTKTKSKIFILHSKDFEKMIEENPDFRNKVASIAKERKTVTSSVE